MALGVRELAKFLHGFHGVAGVHQRGATAHDDRNSEGIGDFLGGCSGLETGLGVKANAVVTMHRDGDRQRDQLFRFFIQGSCFAADAIEFAKRFHDLWLLFGKFTNSGATVSNAIGIGGVGTHGVGVEQCSTV
jgi:hypothetical protein